MAGSPSSTGVLASAMAALLVMLQPCAAQTEPEPISTVRIRVYDDFGRELPATVEKFVAEWGGRVHFTRQFKGLVATKIPWGRYKYRIRLADSADPMYEGRF